jgi:hypothetical protein
MFDPLTFFPESNGIIITIIIIATDIHHGLQFAGAAEESTRRYTSTAVDVSLAAQQR